jgi:hypothetical protein
MRSVNHDRSDRLTTPHQLESVVELFEWQNVSDQIVDIDPTLQS